MTLYMLSYFFIYVKTAALHNHKMNAKLSICQNSQVCNLYLDAEVILLK